MNPSSRWRPSRIWSRLVRAGNRTAVRMGREDMEHPFFRQDPWPNSVVFAEVRRMAKRAGLAGMIIASLALGACVGRADVDADMRVDGKPFFPGATLTQTVTL